MTGDWIIPYQPIPYAPPPPQPPSYIISWPPLYATQSELDALKARVEQLEAEVERLKKVIPMDPEENADQFGYSGINDPKAIFTPAQPEGDLDQFGPADWGNNPLIQNGGQVGSNEDYTE